MTFSITARCDQTGMFGVAVASSSPAVAARCAFARAGIGAVSTQNITDPRLGPGGLDLMATGLSAKTALNQLVAKSPHIEYRQLALIDKDGETAAFSGKKTLGIHHTAQGKNAVAAGNLLANESVPEAMIAAFTSSHGNLLGERLILAMRAGMAAGGEAGPIHSMGLIMVDHVSWHVADLRIDWSDGNPIEECAALWNRWRHEMSAYVSRALNPAEAPSYGVPGDL